MPTIKNKQFYQDLPLNEMTISRLVGEEDLFSRVPKDWHVIITDIKGSTKAVQSGSQQVVNLIATGSIIAALNIAREVHTDIPFFFGGDGATLLIPASLLDQTMQALVEHRENASNSFGLDLRVGQVPVAELYQNNQKLVIAKARLREIFTIPVVLGNGLKYAEKIVKEGHTQSEPINEDDPTLNLEGMECRWNRVKPPENSKEIVCLLVDVPDDRYHATVFKEVLEKIDLIYGPLEGRNPVSISQLRLQATLGKINLEMKARLNRFDLAYLLENWLRTLFGRIYFRFYKSGRLYLENLVQLSDTLVLDGRINTVITGTRQQREQLTEALEQIEQKGDMFFGIHVSPECVMSCYVRDRVDQHIHFIDGSDGGYTYAAKMLKGKMK